MSPELFNYKPYSYKSDVWSLGCVFYEICNLKHAFNAQTINGLAVKILKGNYVPVSTFYSKDLRETIHSMMMVDQKQRPSIKALVQTPFVKKIITRYMVKFARENQGQNSQDVFVECLRGQITKLGLSEAIKVETEGDEAVRQLLIGGRKENFKVDELKSLKLTKELELKNELEKKERLENEMKSLREIKTKLSGTKIDGNSQEKSFKEDFLDNLKVSRSFIQSATQKSETEKAFVDGPEEIYNEQEDYDDFDFVDELEENSDFPKELLDSKIGHCEKRLAKNNEAIDELKSVLNKVSEKLEVTKSRKDKNNFDDSFDDLKEFEEFFPNSTEKELLGSTDGSLEEFRFISCLQDRILQAQKFNN